MWLQPGASASVHANSTIQSASGPGIMAGFLEYRGGHIAVEWIGEGQVPRKRSNAIGLAVEPPAVIDDSRPRAPVGGDVITPVGPGLVQTRPAIKRDRRPDAGREPWHSGVLPAEALEQANLV
jgi:hypothetical protein